MQLVLTGSLVSAPEMERFGVVNRVMAADEDVVEEAVRVAETIAAYSAPAVGLAKQAVKAGMCSRWRPGRSNRRIELASNMR